MSRCRLIDAGIIDHALIVTPASMKQRCSAARIDEVAAIMVPKKKHRLSERQKARLVETGRLHQLKPVARCSPGELETHLGGQVDL